MNNVFKRTDGKTRRYSFFDDMFNVKNLDPNVIKIDEKSNKSICIFYIGHVTFKQLSYVKTNCGNPLYFIMGTLKKIMEINI